MEIWMIALLVAAAMAGNFVMLTVWRKSKQHEADGYNVLAVITQRPPGKGFGCQVDRMHE